MVMRYLSFICSQGQAADCWICNVGPLWEPLTGHEGSVRCVVYSPESTYIISGSEDRTIRLWDAATGQPIGEPLQGHEGYVFSVAFSHDVTEASKHIM
ncbi:hypothetical protein PHLGIDRAFT_362333, partial [Phlebiopsis gigantea 11061_1 CR5-6]